MTSFDDRKMQETRFMGFPAFSISSHFLVTFFTESMPLPYACIPSMSPVFKAARASFDKLIAEA